MSFALILQLNNSLITCVRWCICLCGHVRSKMKRLTPSLTQARSFGSYIVSERCWGKSFENERWCHEEEFWIFALFPFVGAALAALLTRFVFDSHEDNLMCNKVEKNKPPQMSQTTLRVTPKPRDMKLSGPVSISP